MSSCQHSSQNVLYDQACVARCVVCFLPRRLPYSVRQQLSSKFECWLCTLTQMLWPTVSQSSVAYNVFADNFYTTVYLKWIHFLQAFKNATTVSDATRSAAGREFQTTAPKSAKSLAPSSAFVRCWLTVYTTHRAKYCRATIHVTLSGMA